MKSMASWTVWIFSASSSEISTCEPSFENSSSMDMISSTRSRESALRSSTKDALGTTCSSSTPSWSTMIFRTRSKTVVTESPPFSRIGLTPQASARGHGAYRTQDSVDESGRAIAAELLGQLDGFVDGGPNWGLIIHQNFLDCKPEDVAVNNRQLVHRIGRRRPRDDL